jgi:hypothetical protein
MTAFEKLVSFVALGIVGFGASRIRTVLAAEEFKHPEGLKGIYTEVNRESFDGALPAARLDWAVHKSPEASGSTLFDASLLRR